MTVVNCMSLFVFGNATYPLHIKVLYLSYLALQFLHLLLKGPLGLPKMYPQLFQLILFFLQSLLRF